MRPLLLLSIAWVWSLGTAHAGLSQFANVVNVEATVTVGSWYEVLPAYGYAPLEVTIVNNSNQTQTWSFETSSPQTHRRECQIDSSTSLTVEKKSKRTFSILAPLRSRGERFNAPLQAQLVGSSVAGVTNIGFPRPSYSGWRSTHFVAMSEKLAADAWTPLEDGLKKASCELGGSRVQVDKMPEDWRALAGVDALYLKKEELPTLSPAQTAALQDWLARGGELRIFGAEEVPAPWRAAGFGLVIPVPASKVDVPATLAALQNSSGRAELFHDSYHQQWGAYKTIGAVRPNVPLLSIYMLLFAAAVGPVNLFVFARRDRRARLFWTTPALSLAASALLFAMILLQDGFGGTGVRLAVIHLLPDRQKAVVLQEQLSRTGVLVRSSFPLREAAVVVPISPDPFAKGRPTRLRIDGTLFSGDWFRSRSVQGQWIEAIVPTRAEVTLVNGGGERSGRDAPVVISSIDAVLDELYYLDRGKRVWQAKAVGTGVRTLLEPGEWPDELMPSEAGGALEAAWRNAARQPGAFYALTRDAKMFLATQPSIRWQPRPALIMGSVTEAPP